MKTTDGPPTIAFRLGALRGRRSSSAPAPIERERTITATIPPCSEPQLLTIELTSAEPGLEHVVVELFLQ